MVNNNSIYIDIVVAAVAVVRKDAEGVHQTDRRLQAGVYIVKCHSSHKYFQVSFISLQWAASI